MSASFFSISMYNDHSSPSYNLFGSTPSAASTLTAAFTGNSTVVFTQGYKTMRIEGAFTPSVLSTNAYALFELATSEDEGVGGPTNFYELGTLSAIATESAVYSDSGTGMSTGSGIPLIVPGDKTSIGGAAINFSFNVEVNSRYVRVRVKESVGSNFGTIACRVKLQK